MVKGISVIRVLPHFKFYCALNGLILLCSLKFTKTIKRNWLFILWIWLTKQKFWGTFYKDSKYCGVKSPTVVKKKLTVLCMHSKTAHRDPWLYEDWMHIVVKAMKYLRKYFCSCLNYVVFLFEKYTCIFV